ncbi:DUF4209 domain-containing protein [Arenimonas sp. MALMAid1274]|uniref:DUF4209 domain-containing protein n=1 Tax=Arenimonas sp. MALMAid1274 TaxID=3411630 RepID=UPI003BA033E9
MNVERYPEALAVKREDFSDCGWREVLGGSSREGYSTMWQTLSSAARQAMEQGRDTHGKVLWLLADACSMMLSPRSINEPFKPIMVMDGRRSSVPDDLKSEDVAFFAEIVDEIDDVRLKARLADLVWVTGRPREVRFALLAIDAYRSIPLDTETWVRDGRECWERAIGLARMVRLAAGDRLQAIEAAILASLLSATGEDGYLALWLAELLKSNRLGGDRCKEVAASLETLARHFEGVGDLHRAVDYWRMASEWFQLAGSIEKAADATVSQAECLAKQANARVSSGSPSHMAAASFYEDAIQVYRTIPRAERPRHRVDGRIDELRTLLTQSGERSLDEMGTIRSPEIDITKLVEHARDCVRGKSANDALMALVNLHPGVDVKQARKDALESLRRHPLQAFLGATTLSRDGRVIAKRPGLSLSGDPTPEDEIVIRSQMIHDYEILLGLAVQGEILPALEVVLMEHRLREADFIALAAASPIVPRGRERLFGMGLFAGYERSWASAIHLLVPQIENMVRMALKQAGVKTTTLDSNGIENESGMSTLMDSPEAAKVFGDDLEFEFRALFCDANGPNLRNTIAHGLLDDDLDRSIYVVYAWWLALKLVFNSFLVATRRNRPESADGEQK